jgi:hypothetical protein
LEPTSSPYDKGKDPVISLAERLWSAPVFEDIAEPREGEMSQPREHYIPTVMAKKQNKLSAITALKARELSINPPVCEKGDEDVPPPHQPYPKPPAVTIRDRQEQHGHLNRDLPAFFNGDRTKVQDFMCNFIIYWMQNDQHPMFTNLYYCFTTCLARMRGPNINNWVNEMIREIGSKLKNGTYLHTSKKLWTNFCKTFEIAFTDSAAIEKAQAKLRRLVLDPKEPDTYIAKFESLV